jgi:ribosome-binding protein aMBF1 (putative translation factor)
LTTFCRQTSPLGTIASVPGRLGRALQRHTLAFRSVIVEAREHAQLSQRDLAQRLGVHQNIVWRVEQGERRLSVPELFAWADALGVTPETLIRRTRRALDKT